MITEFIPVLTGFGTTAVVALGLLVRLGLVAKKGI